MGASTRETTAAKTKRAHAILGELKRLYPDAHCSLNHASPLELLVATILSAQCTDDRVNLVTRDLFTTYRTAHAYAQASQEQLEQAIQSTGFFRNKAKSIRSMASSLVERHGGQVPDTMAGLLDLAGVGRKTANVVLGNAFGKNEGIVVDTHVGRLAQRMGLTRQQDPVKIEQDLIPLFPQPDWALLAHLLIYHGRKICTARKPLCDQCPLANLCPKIGVAPSRPA